jgi:hypothetical protein
MASSKTSRTKAPGTAVVARVDFRKSQPELYKARPEVSEVRCPKGTFLAVDGVGEPGGPAFQEAIGKLYALGYTAKFAMKKAGGADFAIPALECLWPDDPAGKPKTEWRWRLMLRVPDCVREGALRQVRRDLLEKKAIDTAAVKRVTWAEGRALQVLHVGPYDAVGEAYGKLAREATVRGLACVGSGHEVYINDPRRVPPEKIKTIVRMAVTRPRPS